MSHWNLEGMWVEATYLDDFKVQGKVELSRVRYGGDVAHTIVLENDIFVYGEVRDRVIINHKDIVRVADSTKIEDVGELVSGEQVDFDVVGGIEVSTVRLPKFSTQEDRWETTLFHENGDSDVVAMHFTRLDASAFHSSLLQALEFVHDHR